MDVLGEDFFRHGGLDYLCERAPYFRCDGTVSTRIVGFVKQQHLDHHSNFRTNDLSKLQPFLIVFMDVVQNETSNLDKRFEAWPEDR